jgi:hypothetical protein
MKPTELSLNFCSIIIEGNGFNTVAFETLLESRLTLGSMHSIVLPIIDIHVILPLPEESESLSLHSRLYILTVEGRVS